MEMFCERLTIGSKKNLSLLQEFPLLFLFCLLRYKKYLKGGYLDFSNLNELKNRYITEIYMKQEGQDSPGVLT